MFENVTNTLILMSVAVFGLVCKKENSIKTVIIRSLQLKTLIHVIYKNLRGIEYILVMKKEISNSIVVYNIKSIIVFINSVKSMRLLQWRTGTKNKGRQHHENGIWEQNKKKICGLDDPHFLISSRFYHYYCFTGFRSISTILLQKFV